MIAGNRIIRPDRCSRLSRFYRLALKCLVFPLCLLVNGCSAGDSDSPSIADLPGFEIEQDLRIDGHAADLLSIRWMGVAGNGTIAVFQNQLNGVRFFDSEGNDLGLVGRRGEGPGEFQMLTQGGWVGDTLWVNDFLLKRITLISIQPAIVRVLPQLVSIHPRPEDSSRFPAVSMFATQALYPEGTTLIDVPGRDAFEGSGLIRVFPDGLIDRLVLNLPQDTEGRVVMTREGGSAVMRVPFYPEPDWVVSSDGSRIATLTTNIDGPEAGTFSVSLFDALGEPIFSRAYPFQPISIPDHVRDSTVDASSDMASRLGINTDIGNRIPRTFPPVREILLGDDGRTWIELHGGAEGTPWLILGPEGEPQGRVVFPARTVLHVANGTHVWALERDELDVESIVRYRLVERD